MKKVLIIWLIVMAILSTGCSKSAAPVANPAPVVQKKTVVEAFGTLQVKEKININIDFPAFVEKVHVVDGQKIKTSDVLVTLNAKDYKTEISSKQKDLNIANLEIEQAKNNVFIDHENDPSMRKLENDLKTAQGLYEVALKEYKDQELLYKQDAISQYDLAQTQKNLDMKKKEVDDVSFSIESLKESRQKETSRINIQNEKYAAIRNEISLMNSKLNKPYISGNHIISTVHNGIVYDIGYTAGDLIDSTKKMLSIMDLDTLYVEAEVSEEFIKDIKLNAVATIIPTADKSKEYKGKVVFISNKALVKNGETIVPIHISLDSPDEFLMPNFNVDVNIEMN